MRKFFVQDLINAVHILNNAHLIMPEYIDILINETIPRISDFELYRGTIGENICRLICKLNHSNIFTENNFYQLTRMENDFNRYDLFIKLINLSDENALDQLLFDYIMQSGYAAMAAIALSALIAADIFTPENIQIVKDNDSVIHFIIDKLYASDILTDDTLEILLDGRHEALLTSEAIDMLWTILPPEEIRNYFNHLLSTARQENPEEALQVLVTQILEVLEEPVMEDEDGLEVEDMILHAQNTHTASVHRSVSESAGRLLNRYNPNFAAVSRYILDILVFIKSPIHK